MAVVAYLTFAPCCGHSSASLDHNSAVGWLNCVAFEAETVGDDKVAAWVVLTN